MKKQFEKRTKFRAVRFTESEDEYLLKRMSERGYKSVSRYIRDCALGIYKKPISEYSKDEKY